MRWFEAESKDTWTGRVTGGERSFLAYLLRSLLIALYLFLLSFIVPSLRTGLLTHAEAPFGVLATVWRWPGEMGFFFIWGTLAALLVSAILLPLCLLLWPVALVTAATSNPTYGFLAAGFVVAWLPPFRAIFRVVWIIRLLRGGGRSSHHRAQGGRTEAVASQRSVPPAGVRTLWAALFSVLFFFLGETRAVPEMFYTLSDRSFAVLGSVAGFIAPDSYGSIGDLVLGLFRLVLLLVVGLVGGVIALGLYLVGLVGKALHEYHLFFLLGLPVGWLLHGPLGFFGAVFAKLWEFVLFVLEVALDAFTLKTRRGRLLSAGFVVVIGLSAVAITRFVYPKARAAITAAQEAATPDSLVFFPERGLTLDPHVTVTVPRVFIHGDQLELSLHFASLHPKGPHFEAIDPEQTYLRDDYELLPKMHPVGGDGRLPLGERVDLYPEHEGILYFPRPARLSRPFVLVLNGHWLRVGGIDLSPSAAQEATSEETTIDGMLGVVSSLRRADAGKRIMLEVAIRLERGGEMSVLLTPEVELVGSPPTWETGPWAERGSNFVRAIESTLTPGTRVAVVLSTGGDEGGTFATKIEVLSKEKGTLP